MTFYLDDSSPIATRGLFSVDCSCLLYKRHLLASQMPSENLHKTYLFCYNNALSKQQGVERDFFYKSESS